MTSRTRKQRAADLLRGFWRTRMGKVTAVLVVAALWVPPVLLVPAAWYGWRGGRLLMRRLLYSVRAKLAAFYLYAALLPILLVATVLLFVGYVVLGQVSARVVESRLDGLTEWAEQRSRLLEATYWEARASGSPPRVAAQEALQRAYGDVRTPGFACWALDASGRLLEGSGPVEKAGLVAPAWLARRRFTGVTVPDSNSMRLELRTRLPLAEGPDGIEFGAVLPLETPLLNANLGGDTLVVRAALGPPARGLVPSALPSDSVLARDGIFAFLSPRSNLTVSPTSIRYGPRQGARDAVDDGIVPQRPGARPALLSSDSTRSEAPAGYESGRLRIRSRYGLLNWLYVGYPLEWDTGSTSSAGPPIVVVFSVEGATRALLRTGIGVFPPVLLGVGVVLGFLLLLQIIATLMGFAHARSISDSVSKLDRGVRAIQAGDFDYRIKPRERDQLGGLALAFNDMSQRLQQLLDERAAHQVVERELEIARDVQARLFPERMPYTPFLEAGGVCVPARTVSGDWYDFIEVKGGWDAVVADVSGKGMSAALLMASLHAALHGLYLRDGREESDAAALVTRLNQHLHQYAEPTRFVTLFLVRYRGGGQLEYCNAGHNPAVLLRDGRVEWLSSGGPVLGPFPDLVYESVRVPVFAGDVVCLYSDGVTEALSPQGEPFGEERLAQTLQAHSSKHPRQVVTAVQEELRQWRGEAEIGDDVTLVVLRIVG